MKPREFVQAAFRFEETDPVPYWIIMEPEVEKRLDDYYGSPSWRERVVPYVTGSHVGFRTDPLEGGTVREPFGAILQEGNILHVVRAPLSRPCLQGYQWPDPGNLEDWDELARRYRGQEGSFRLCGLAMGLFERAWLMRGFENFMMDLVDHPVFVEQLLDGITDIHLRTMNLIHERVPIEAYFGGDDWSDQRDVMMGIENWRKFFKPRLRRIIGRCHELGLPYVLHSCGNVLHLADDLIEIGLDGLESLQPEAMDVYELKRRTAGKLVLVGGMGVQSTLRFGAPDDVRAETRRLIRELGDGGGYVLASAKPMMADVPTQNAVAFVESACQLEVAP